MNIQYHTVDDIAATLKKVGEWTCQQQDIVAVALVGSYARNQARDDSDIDLVVLTTQPDLYLEHHEWLDYFGDVHSVRKESYGMVTSLHVHYVNGYEVEFGITSPAWANVPTDHDTCSVVAKGLLPIYDPEDLLGRLIAHVASVG